MHRAFLFFLLLAANGVMARADDVNDLDLSFADQDKKVQDTSNQKLGLPTKQGLDKNMDYSGSFAHQDLEPLPEPVRPPALGTRGYRPSLVGIGYGDRTPGVGAYWEFSFNRLGMGAAASLMRESKNVNHLFASVYGTYRLLPFEVSPFLLMGAGYAEGSLDSFGLLTGIGVEAQVYQGITVIMGYTYFSALNKGYWGGSVAWGF